MYCAKLSKRIIARLSVALLVGSISLSSVAVNASTLGNDSAVAGMSVSLNNYYANSESPEADILNYLKPMVGASVEKETAAAVNVKIDSSKGVVTGTASAEDLVADEAVSQTSGIVSTINRLHMRKAPSTSAPIVAYLYSNCKVEIFDTVVNDEATWYLVRSNGIEGYISADYVLTGAQAEAAEESIQNRYATILVDELSVYNTAASGATVIDTVYKGEVYGVMEAHGDYIKIRISENHWGYVRRDSVQINTQFSEAVAVDDEFIKQTLESYIRETDDAKRIYDERIAVRDYVGAKYAIEYAIEVWGYYINTATEAGLDDLVIAAKVQRADAELLRDSVSKIIAEIEKEASENVVTPTNPPASSEAATQPSTEATQPSTEAAQPSTEASTAEQKTVVEIEASHSRGVRYAGEVLAASDLYLKVVYSDGTVGEITDPNAWYSPEVGMILAEGLNIVTMYYGDLRSSFELNVLPAQTEAPPVTEAPTLPPATEAPTLPPATEAPTLPPVTEAPTEAPKTIVQIVAGYSGLPKYSGEILSASELYIDVVYSDGSVVTITDPNAWYCPQVGMTMTLENNVVTMYYGEFSSSFALGVLPAPTEAPPATEAPTAPPVVETPTEAPTAPPVVETPTEAPTAPPVTEAPVVDTTLSAARQTVVNNAAYWVGKCNYVYGTNNLTIGGSVDCSAFTMNIFATVGVSLPRTSTAQLSAGTHITYDQLRPGDLVCYSGHVAIYIGNGAIIHAKNANAGIVYDNVFFSPTQPPIAYVSVLP